MDAKRLGVVAAIAVAGGLLLLPGRFRHRGHVASSASASGPPVHVRLTVSDGNGALPCRVHLLNERNEAVFSPGFPSFSDHFSFPGNGELEVPPGTYRYEIERGPEYARATGSFSSAEPQHRVTVKLERVADLAARGWFSGDLHVHRPVGDAELLMRAEDLHVGEFVTWWNDQPAAVAAGLRSQVRRFDGDRFVDPTAGEDERQGGALLLLRLNEALALPHLYYDEKGRIAHKVGSEADEYPPAIELVRAARAQGEVHVALEKPFWWDTPTWVALGLVDSVGIAHNHMNRSGVRNHEAWGRKCDRAQYGDGPFGNAYCTQDIYYRLLDAGLRLAPSAGSASGVLPNPVGYNRVYVKSDTLPDLDTWWRLLAQGRSFVTNGPLLLVEANKQPPGSILRAENAPTLSVELGVELTSVDPIAAVELVRDGAVTGKGSYDPSTQRVTFPPLVFEKSGWFLLRALTSRTDTFRFASTAPFYVEVGAVPRRISRAAVKFFRAWTEERIAAIEGSPLDPEKAKILVSFQREGANVWDRLLTEANAD
ncbi:MAG TPA: hypothetical protein VNN72_01725 [Polyangiaceae bacterium]|nr:hypothetical protein [Polyangiaceae bacterium]